MNQRRRVTIDANEAVAAVAHRTSEVIAIYPITPASPMGEFADAWSSKGRPNAFGLSLQWILIGFTLHLPGSIRDESPECAGPRHRDPGIQ